MVIMGVIMLIQPFSYFSGLALLPQVCPQVELKRAYLATLSAKIKIDIVSTDTKAFGTKTVFIIGDDKTQAQKLAIEEAKKVLPMEEGWMEHTAQVEEIDPEFLAQIIKE